MNMKLKKITALLLALLLCVGLFAGCGKNTEGEETEENKTESSSEKKNDEVEEPEETPEYVYTAQYIPIKGEYTNGFGNMLYDSANDRFFVTLYDKIGDNTPEGVTPEWEGEYWVYGERMFWLSMDGTLDEITGYTPTAVEGNDSAYVSATAITPDGNIAILECVYRSSYDGPDDVELYSDEWYEKEYYNYETNWTEYYIRVIDGTGAEVSSFDINDFATEITESNGWFYVYGFFVGEDGNFYFSSENCLFSTDNEGNILAKNLGEDTWFETMTRLSDGRVVTYCYGEEGNGLYEVNTETFEMSGPVECDSLYNIVENSGCPDYDLYYTDGSNLMGFRMADGSKEKVLNWINCDVDSNDITKSYVLADGRIACLVSEWDEDYNYCENTLTILTKVPYDSAEKKTTLVLAAEYLESEVQDMVIKFNRNNPEYRIEVRDYSEYNTDDDYSAGITKLTTEILSGNVPDIICLSDLPYEQMVSQGLLADLYPLMDADSDINRDDIFPAILNAVEVDGHLYRTVSSFGLATLLGASQIVGDEPGWTLEDCRKALKMMPEGCDLLDIYTTRSNMLSTMLYMEIDSLVNWETGECNFDSQLFRDIIDFAGQFPEDYTYDEDYVWTEEDDTPSRLSSGKQMLVELTLSDFDEFQSYSCMLGGSATLIGYPVAEGVGNALEINDSGVAISADCEYPEAAWEFVKTYFTEKYQETNVWSFPSNQAAFDAKLKAAMTPQYQTDEDGNYVLDENGEKIELSRGGWGWGSFNIEYYALSQEDADKILSAINSAEHVYQGNLDDTTGEIINIITEDTQAYYAGQKSLDDTVKQLQSRLNIFVNEHR